jgi:Leucine-rich repeat (LRR) protein
VTQFPALKYFYFHKNMLSDVTEVRKLVTLKELKYLTLHGNPIEINVPYLRSYVLCLLPGLNSLNCTPVTKGDRKISDVWGGMNKNLLPKYSNKNSKK